MSADHDADRRAPPVDLVGLVIFVVLAVALSLLPGIRGTTLSTLITLPIMLFAPGYVVVAVLFPAASSHAGESAPDVDETTTDLGSRGMSGSKRAALSFGASLAIVVATDLILSLIPGASRLVSTVAPIGALTLALAYLAARRRTALDPSDRLHIPYERWIERARSTLLEPDTRTDLALNILVVVSVILALGSVGYAVGAPRQAGTFSEFYILTEDESGELVADDYPTEFTAGESQQLIVGVGNYEYETVTYTVVSELQRVRIEDNSTRVLEVEPLEQFSSTVPHNKSWHYRHRFTPTMTGERLRLTYMLYRGDLPAEPTTDNAYREVHLWVNVTAPTNGTAEPSVRPEGLSPAVASTTREPRTTA
ncbi:DUF1616 domain-containing protein [Haloplanus ruber]|uniref:DUF1616 domain-containing protein n=1 Tax=Haloplanus ruber TaxID=869892 RepID=A0ABD6CX93_9EURY|nr:DUF1616 domain-containing protein [Haloplanus ruber]